MKRRRPLAVALLAVGISMSVGTPADAAVSQVHSGNFYFEDATVGDGKIEIRQGDQLRVIMDDNGPGTPHSVEVDELGIHSGGLSSGETYTTPPIQQAGTFKLYCKLHENKGHATTLVVLANAATPPTTTATAPPTTTATAPPSATGTPTTAPAATAPGAPAAIDDPTQATDPAAATDPTATTTSTIAGATATGNSPETTERQVAPSGVGRASDEDLESIPVDPDSLEAALGRPPAKRGPWTRSVRMALLGLVPLLGAAALALGRFARTPAHNTVGNDITDAATGTQPAARRPGPHATRPLKTPPGAVEPT
jgi:plastocyanin